MPSTRPNLTARASDWRSAVPLSKLTADGFRIPRTLRVAPRFSSSYRVPRAGVIWMPSRVISVTDDDPSIRKSTTALQNPAVSLAEIFVDAEDFLKPGTADSA